jgi:hypothetical protein
VLDVPAIRPHQASANSQKPSAPDRGAGLVEEGSSPSRLGLRNGRLGGTLARAGISVNEDSHINAILLKVEDQRSRAHDSETSRPRAMSSTTRIN